jgi:hypothetical protein
LITNIRAAKKVFKDDLDKDGRLSGEWSGYGRSSTASYWTGIMKEIADHVYKFYNVTLGGVERLEEKLDATKTAVNTAKAKMEAAKAALDAYKAKCP